jgi:hypothetical protein
MMEQETACKTELQLHPDEVDGLQETALDKLIYGVIMGSSVGAVIVGLVWWLCAA